MRNIKQVGLAAALSVSLLATGCAVSTPTSPAIGHSPDNGRIERAHAASVKIVDAIHEVDGSMGVHTARTHDGVELILAWFENRDAVLGWFEHPYHRKLLREAGRDEDGIAAQHFSDDSGPILVIASVAYEGSPGSLDGSMFDDPDGRRPTRFSVEYYTPLSGGAYMVQPLAPASVAESVYGLRDVFDDE